MKKFTRSLRALSLIGVSAVLVTSPATAQPVPPVKISSTSWYVQVGLLVNPSNGVHRFINPPAGPGLWCTPAEMILNGSASVRARDYPLCPDSSGVLQRTRHDSAPHANDVVPSTPWEYDITVPLPSTGPFAVETRVSGSRTHPGAGHADVYSAVVGALLGTVPGPSLEPRFVIIHGSLGKHMTSPPPPGPSPIVSECHLTPPSGLSGGAGQDYPMGMAMTLADPSDGKLLMTLVLDGMTTTNISNVYVRNGANGPIVGDLRPLMTTRALDSYACLLYVPNRTIPVELVQLMLSGNAVLSVPLTNHPDGQIVGALSPVPTGSSYDVTLRPGWNVLANQLSIGSNTLADVLPSVPSGSSLWRFDANTQGYSLSTYDSDLGGWDNPNLTLAPGDGVFIHNSSSSNFTVTFVGETITPYLPLSLPPDQLAMVARQIPSVATYEQITGLPPAEGTKLYRYDSSTQQDPFTLSNWMAFTFSQGQWTPGTPNTAVGEPVFIQMPSATTPSPTNLPPVSVRQLANGLLELSWPTQTVNAVLQSATSLNGHWSTVGQVNPLRLQWQRIDRNCFFRLAAASATPSFWDLDGDGTHELEQTPDGLAYPTASGTNILPARAWAVVQRNNGFIAYVDSQGTGHFDAGYQLSDLDGDWTFGGGGEVLLIPTPELVVPPTECAPSFKLLCSTWRDSYVEPNGWAVRNKLTNLSPGTYVSLKVDGWCGLCSDNIGPSGCDKKEVKWNISNPTPGSGYSGSGDQYSFYADRAASFHVEVTVTCYSPCTEKEIQQKLTFDISWGGP